MLCYDNVSSYCIYVSVKITLHRDVYKIIFRMIRIVGTTHSLIFKITWISTVMSTSQICRSMYLTSGTCITNNIEFEKRNDLNISHCHESLALFKWPIFILLTSVPNRRLIINDDVWIHKGNEMDKYRCSIQPIIKISLSYHQNTLAFFIVLYVFGGSVMWFSHEPHNIFFRIT